jgi:hypothetical protein
VTIEECITNLLGRLNSNSSLTEPTTLYAQQVNAKLKNAKYSIDKLTELEQLVVRGTGTDTPCRLNYDEKVNFFCDCFWDFLRSSIDILGQLINHVCQCGLNERSVDIKNVAQTLNQDINPRLKVSVDRLINSRAFNTLENYRHCSIHRRQVFIEIIEQEVSIRGTIGYPDYRSDSSTSEVKKKTYASHICRNPWELQPNVDYNQTVASFCSNLLNQIERMMVTVLNRIYPSLLSIMPDCHR